MHTTHVDGQYSGSWCHCLYGNKQDKVTQTLFHVFPLLGTKLSATKRLWKYLSGHVEDWATNHSRFFHSLQCGNRTNDWREILLVMIHLHSFCFCFFQNCFLHCCLLVGFCETVPIHSLLKQPIKAHTVYFFWTYEFVYANVLKSSLLMVLWSVSIQMDLVHHIELDVEARSPPCMIPRMAARTEQWRVLQCAQ